MLKRAEILAKILHLVYDNNALLLMELYDMLGSLLKYFKRDDAGEPPWNYYFLINLEEEKYPAHLKKLFKYKTGYELHLNNPKTFNEKIQYIKLYGASDLKRRLSDKILARSFAAEKIGAQYLKPVLQICSKYEEIDFDKLPDSFVIKCCHGCKWQAIIENKERHINNGNIQFTQNKITGWLEQEFWPWGGFEMQYKGIEPKIIIEPLLRENLELLSPEINVYCFNGTPKIIVKIHGGVPDNSPGAVTIYDESLRCIENIFNFKEDVIDAPADENIKLALLLSGELSKNIDFVRVDWMIYKNQLYFAEMTFTPFSGFVHFRSIKDDLKLGKLINIERKAA